MVDARSAKAPQPSGARGRWTSFVAAVVPAGRRSRALHEDANPQHRVRVEHDNHTLLVHISDEEGRGWTTVAIDRGSRTWAVAQRDNQLDAAAAAHESLYETTSAGD